MELIIPQRSETIDTLYAKKSIPFQSDIENHYCIFKCGSQSAPVLLAEGRAFLVEKPKTIHGITPRNIEQQWAMDALLDDNIKIAMLTGRAGTGKTLLALAAALQGVDDQTYDGILLIRPMTQVGNHEFGILPGNIEEKYLSYLGGFLASLEALTSRDNIEDVMRVYNITPMPLQFIRGASWANKIILADEIQTLNRHELLTLGTRVGDNSKLVLMGDMRQRDEEIDIEETGLHKFMQNPKTRQSSLSTHIELTKVERGPVAKLFGDVLD